MRKPKAKKYLVRTLKIAVTTLVVLFVACTIWLLSGEGVREPGEITWGVSFFPRQARDLGLDWKAVY
ncbi:MAG: hypothetical protein U1C18_00465, partial [Patescibacteria group bacterium]|nr:hypothetical protein [Patescibacteria group bacterium]